MASLCQLRALVLVGLVISLAACRPRFHPDYEAEVSLSETPGAPLPSEEAVAEALRARLAILPFKAKIDPGRPGDARLTIRLVAADKDEALASLDTLCHSGDLRVRAVHDQSVYLSAAARRDPSKLPADYQILNYTVTAGGKSRIEDLVVSTADILTGADVKTATAIDSAEGDVHILLTVKGGQKLMEATRPMQKGRSRLAIIYDGLIISAPVVGTVLSSEFTLEGFNSYEEARSVAVALHKPLATNLLIESLKPLARQASKP